MRILLAEDDSILADGLACCLRQSGFRVDWVADGQAAAEVIQQEEFDLLILDIVLPKVSGEDVLNGVRARIPHLPVLAISALDGIADRVRTLNMGADDYLPKPFDLAEFEARVRALTRRNRNGENTNTLYRFGPLSFDRVGRTARLDGRILPLASRELELLGILIENSNRWVKSAEFSAIFAERGAELSRNAIDVYMHRLRNRLGEDMVRVVTTRGLGYRLVEAQQQPLATVM